jgi:hypothetical protein
MSGQQGQWDALSRRDQSDPRDATHEFSRHANPYSNGNGSAAPPGSEPASLTEAVRPGAPEHPQADSADEQAQAELAAEQVQADPSASPPRAIPVELGARAVLKQRLERLPFGHPSSPYHVDGEHKPAPPRLKHLELAPPGRERPASSPPPADSAWTGPAILGEPGASALRFGEPDADAALEASDGLAVTPAAESADSDVTSTFPAVTAASPAVTDSDGAAPPVPTTADETPPPAPAPPPPEPGIEADGSWTWGAAVLTRDQVRIAEDAHDRFREAEGRNLFGSYHHDGLTARLRLLEERLQHGQLGADTEEAALLSPDVFKVRFADMLRRHPERRAEQLALRVPGALSYSFVFDVEHYSEGIWLAQDALEARQFQLQARRNAWNSAANRCVYTMWRDPVSDMLFQVQFHTMASLEAQQLARMSATLVSDPRIPDAEAEVLRSDIATTWAALPAPPGNSRIGDYRREASVPSSAPSLQAARHSGQSSP